MEINKAQLETLAVNLLDDDEGICEAGWTELEVLLEQVNSIIPNAVEATNGRFYLGTEKVKGLREKIVA
jgi:hypothetical protein